MASSPKKSLPSTVTFFTVSPCAVTVPALSTVTPGIFFIRSSTFASGFTLNWLAEYSNVSAFCFTCGAVAVIITSFKIFDVLDMGILARSVVILSFTETVIWNFPSPTDSTDRRYNLGVTFVKIKAPVLSLTVLYAVNESAGCKESGLLMSFTVAPAMGELSLSSVKMPLTVCALVVLRKKNNRKKTIPGVKIFMINY